MNDPSIGHDELKEIVRLMADVQRWHEVPEEQKAKVYADLIKTLMASGKSEDRAKFEWLAARQLYDRMMNVSEGEVFEKTRRFVVIEKTIKGNKTGKGGKALEIRVPKEVRDLLRIDEHTTLKVIVDLQRRSLILDAVGVETVHLEERPETRVLAVKARKRG